MLLKNPYTQKNINICKNRKNITKGVYSKCIKSFLASYEDEDPKEIIAKTINIQDAK